ncbi:hypothetical protein BDZ89DRAFT_1071606 [Hymenopellis radicata]|nr:hypothetical protein BDZ89DRAFT_1071606 [Hymenopellis radicata]
MPDAAKSDVGLLFNQSPSRKRAASPRGGGSDFSSAKRLRAEGGDIEGDYKNTAGMSSYNDLEMSPLPPLPETPVPAGNASTDDSAMDVDSTPRPAPSSTTAMLISASFSSLPKFNPVSQIHQQAKKAGQALISAAQASPKKTGFRKGWSPLSDSEESGHATSTLRVPQTPAKLPSFAKPTQSSLAKTAAPPKLPIKGSFRSPSKFARSSTHTTRPAETYALQTDAKVLLNQYYRKANELNSSMMSHTPAVLRPPGVPRSAPALQRSITRESALRDKAGPSSARSNEANHVGKRMLTGRVKSLFPNNATHTASQKTPPAAVADSPVRVVIDLTEDDDSFSESDNRARLVSLRARTKDDELKVILDRTLNRKEASPEKPMRVSTAEAFDNLRQAREATGPSATAPRRGLGSASSKRKSGLTVLSHVRVFVDVRDADTSRDSGEAFVGFLEQLCKGSHHQVFKNFTPTCTHIVFRNGSFNTVSKWKAAEPKPLVVRLSWVIACVIQMEHVAEEEHLLDISDLFPSGVDPKIRLWGLCESMDSSSKPLEMARQRDCQSRKSGHR